MDTFLCNQLSNGSNKCLWLVLGGGLVLIQCRRMHLSSKRTAYLKIANCIVISRRTAERVVGPAFCVWYVGFFTKKSVAFLLCVGPVFVE